MSRPQVFIPCSYDDKTSKKVYKYYVDISTIAWAEEETYDSRVVTRLHFIHRNGKYQTSLLIDGTFEEFTQKLNKLKELTK